MALVSCKECGAKVAGSAQTCPTCGVSYPGGAGQFIVIRSAAMTGAMYAVQVTIDGQLAGEIKNGGAATFDLLAGEHQVDVRGGGMSNSVVVQILDGQATR